MRSRFYQFLGLGRTAHSLVLSTICLLAFGVINYSANAQNSSSQNTETLTADAGVDRLIEVGLAARLDGSGSINPSGLPITYAWNLAERPAGSSASLTNTVSPFPSLMPDLAGEYRAELIVTNSAGTESEPSSVLLTTGNISPVAMAGGDRFTLVGQSIRLDPEGTFDANGDRLEANWSILSFPADSPSSSDIQNNAGETNTICPAETTEVVGTYHVVSATSNQQNPELTLWQPLAEGTTETGTNSATINDEHITMDLTGDPLIFLPEGEIVEVVLSSAWDEAARAEILMSADGESFTSLGTAGQGGSVYGPWSPDILRYDDFAVPAGGARFLKLSHQAGNVRADGVVYGRQCIAGQLNSEASQESETPLATLEEDAGGRFVFTPTVPGTYSVELRVEDEQGAQSTDIVEIYVAPADGSGNPSDTNIKPVANAGVNQVYDVGQELVLDGSRSTDVNGDRLTYKWSILSKPEGSFPIIENAQDAISRFVPDADQTYVLQLAVTDARGLSDYDTVVLSQGPIGPFAVSGGPIPRADGAITASSGQVSAETSTASSGQTGTLAYAWSELSLSAGQGEFESPAAVESAVTFGQSGNSGDITEDLAIQGLDFLGRYNLISFGDLNSNVDTGGLTLVGGNVVGGSASFATQLISANGSAVLEVAGDIRGGAKNINNGGDVHVGGSVKSKVNLDGGGQIFNDSVVDIQSAQASAIALSASLAELTTNSVATLPSSQNGPVLLTAQPDDNGVAIFDIPDGNDLFNNKRVQQIELIDNGAASIIINVGGNNIQFNKGNFVGSITSDEISRRIIWNFPEATILKTKMKFEGSVLAPYAFFHNQTEVDGSVVAARILERGRIGFPSFSGTGLVGGAPVEPTQFSLIQVAVTDTENPEFGPSYDTTVLTTGNKRPVAIAALSSGTSVVTPGSDVSLGSAGSFDGDNDQLSYGWSTLSTPSGSALEINDTSSGSISVSPDVSGTYIFQLLVSDGQLVSRPATVTFVVENTAPVAEAGEDQVAAKRELVSLSGLSSSDTDGDDLSYAWVFSETPDGSVAELLNANTPTPSFETDLGGTYVVTLVVNDGFESSDPDTITITVENNLPLAVIEEVSDGFVGDTFSVNGLNSSDADGDTLTYSWLLIAPDGSEAVLSSATEVMPMFTADVAGTYVISLIVNDGESSSLPAEATVEASSANRAPVLEPIEDKTVPLGSTLSFQLSAVDPDGDQVAFGINPLPLPAGAAFDVTTGVFQFTPTSLLGGGITLTFGASDGVLSDSESVVLSVTNDNASSTTDYTGRIVDADTGAPISNVLVMVGDISALTDVNGVFTLSGLDAGQNSVWIVAGAQTDVSVDNRAYGSTQISINLIENVLNEAVNDIGLTPISALAQAVPGQSVTVENDALGVSLTIPADGVLGEAISSRYWRVLVNGVVSPSELASLAEFELRGVPNGPNLLTNGTASASSVFSSSFVPSNAFDGNTSTGWASTDGAAAGEWIAYDLGAGNEISAAEVSITARGTTRGVLQAPTDFDLQVSQDGVNWTTVKNYQTSPDWAALESRSFDASEPFNGTIGIRVVTAAQANTLPPNIVPCQMFSLEPKTIRFSKPITLTVDNYDELPAGTNVDVWVFTDGEFKRSGVGTVTADAALVEATLRGIPGGALIALSPRPSSVATASDQPGTTYIPSLLGEGNYATSLSLPGYSSNGSSRGLSFVYNSTAAAPAPIVGASLTVGDVMPATLSSRVTIGGVDFGIENSVDGSDAQTGDDIRQAVQINADSLPTGVNEYQFLSISEYACTKVGQVATGKVFVDNQTDSPFGQGWSLAELSRIYPQEDGSVLIRDGNGTLTNFEARTDFSTLGDPVRLPALGPYIGQPVDLDGDGDQDILWLLSEEGGIGIYENLGDEQFVQRRIIRSGLAVDVPPAGSHTPDNTQIATGDFDSDGRLDIVMGSQLTTRLVIFYGNGDGFSFEAARSLTGFNTRSLQADDFNGDGLDDILAFGRTGTQPVFYAGRTSRNLVLSRAEGTSPANNLGSRVVDYNKDGLPDVISRSGTRITGWRSRPNLPPIRDFITNGSFSGFLAESLEGFDADGDGISEIFVTSSTSGILIYKRNEEGVYQNVGLLDVPGNSLGTAEFDAEDLNNDGLNDIIIARGQRVITFFNDPDGLFFPAEVVPTDASTSSARLADFNGDGSFDLVSDSQRDDQLLLYFSDPMRSSRFIDPLNDYTEMVRNEDGTYERRYKDGATIFYAASGLQTAKSDSNGNITSYTYDAEDRISTITDPVGLVTDFTYGGNGKLTQITYPDGRTSKWTYNAAGQLIRSEDVNGDVSLHEYDEQGRLTAKTDPRGLTTEILYGPAGRYAGSVLPDGTQLKLELAKTLGLPDLGGGELTPGSGGVTSVTDGRGNVTTTRVNDFGSPVEITDPLGRVTRYTRDANNNVIAIDAPSSVTGDQRLLTEIDYDDLGNVIAKREAVGTSSEREMTYSYEPVFNKMIALTDYDGFETTRTYDEFGNMLTETDPLGGVITMTYDGRGLPTSRTDKNDNLTQLIYNDRGLPITTIDPSGTVSEYTYDDAGNLLTQTDDFGGSLSRDMSYTYDEKNRILTETAADGGVTTYAYDGNDNVTSTTDPTGIVETRSYDDRDRLQTINDPASGTTVFTYDEDSNILRMTDALGETTEFTYDAVDRLLSSIDAKGQLRAFAYDSRDNITAVTDARANMTMMGYDVLDRPVARTNPKGEQWNFAYDARDNRISATKPDGVVLISEYDGLSRLTRIAGGDIERTYSYDPQSNLLAANDNLNGVAGPDLGFTYDRENRLETASVTNLFGGGAQNNVFTYGYDALDRRASMSDSFGGNTAYAYDPVDRLTRITTPQNEVFTQSYDLAGRMLGRIAPNTTVTDRTYEDGTGRLMSQTQAASDTAFNGFTYDYTDRGNIAEIAETGTLARTKRYSYDELERLTEVDVPEAPTEDESYTLDPEGNRITSQLSANHETDVANRLTGDDAYSYIYDLNGNLISKTAKPGVNRPDWTYDYDDLDQLISVSRDGVEVERYRYDAFGRRSVIETANDNAVFERTALVNDGSDRTIDLLQDGAGATQIQNRYTHGGQVDEPLSLEVFAPDGTLDQSYTYHADHLGSIRFVTDSVGTIVNAYEYDSYGRPGFELEQVAQPFRYTGREWDQATELYHYRARQYDPETGRFLQEDPIGFAAGDLNLQRYVGSNPLNYTDPSGMSAIETAGTRGGALGSTASIANIGIRLNCIFAAVSTAVDIAGTPNLETLEVVMTTSGLALECGAKAKFKKKKKKDKKDEEFCPLTCFAAGTEVHTREGLKNIEDIVPGDEVKSMDPVTGEIAYKTVLNTHINRFDPTGTVSIVDDIDGSETHLSVTAEHPFYHSEKGWVHAAKLVAGDLLIEDEGGTLRVTTVVFNSDSPLNVTYNLEVADFHTYFVGKDGVLVHNAKGGKNRTPNGVRSNVADAARDFANRNPSCSDGDIKDHLEEIFGELRQGEFKSTMKFLLRANKKKRNSRGF